MKFKLVIVAGEGLRNEVELTAPVVIGRSRGADVTIGHPLVSRRHCEITEGDDNLLIVEDLGSLNGTFVGDVRINEPVYLEPGDYLTVGSVTFQAIYGDKTEADFPAEDGTGQATEEMPDFAPAGEAPADPDEQAMMFVEDQPAPAKPAAPAEGVDFGPLADEPTQDAPPTDNLEVVETADADDGEQVDQLDVVDDEAGPPPQDSDGSGLDWLTGPSGDEAGAQKSSGEDDLDDFFKKL